MTKFSRRSGNSYRLAIYKDGYGSRFKKIDKRLASRAVRNHKESIPDGMAYKKIYNSYDICDYEFDCRYDDMWLEMTGDAAFKFNGTNYLSK